MESWRGTAYTASQPSVARQGSPEVLIPVKRRRGLICSSRRFLAEAFRPLRGGSGSRLVRASVKDVAESYGGSVTLQTARGSGAEFRLRLRSA